MIFQIVMLTYDAMNESAVTYKLTIRDLSLWKPLSFVATFNARGSRVTCAESEGYEVSFYFH